MPMRPHLVSRSVFKAICSAFALLFMSYTMVDESFAQAAPEWCDCQGMIQFCPPDANWWEGDWEDDIAPNVWDCAEYHGEGDTFMQTTWVDWVATYLNATTDASTGRVFSAARATTSTFDWDRDDDGLVTPIDLQLFIEDSSHCNAQRVIEPAWVPNHFATPSEIVDLVSIYLSQETSAQMSPEPWAVASAFLQETFPVMFGRRPSGIEIASAISGAGFGGTGLPDFIVPSTACQDMNHDGLMMLNDSITAFVAIDLNADGDGSGSSAVDPFVMLLDLIEACVETAGPNIGYDQSENLCDAVDPIGATLGMMLITPLEQDVREAVECEDGNPTNRQSEGTTVAYMDGNFRDDIIYCGMDPSPNPSMQWANTEIDGEQIMVETQDVSSDNPCGDDEGNAGGDVVTVMPVSATRGHKFEQAMDAVVRLPGRDLQIMRLYNSKDDLYVNPGLRGSVGENWSLSVFNAIQVQWEWDHVLELWGFAPKAAPNVCAAKDYGELVSGHWRSTGPVTQHLSSEATLQIGTETHDVWRLLEPGQWERDYFRYDIPGFPLEGMLLQERDSYGNALTYFYDQIGQNSNGYRVSYIQASGTPGDTDSANAIIEFDWHRQGDLAGRLQRIRILRKDKWDAWVSTNEVEYLYVDSDVPFLSNDLGVDGDLIQVINRSSLDQAQEPKWRERITQYRYHTTTTPASNDDERFEIAGKNHQLKLVIQPQQVEFVAQYNNQDFSYAHPDAALHKTAGQLLTWDDDAFWTGSEDALQYQVIDLASKLISYSDGQEYDPDRWVVTSQYIQADCGCGSGTQGVRQDYSYLAWDDGNGYVGRTTMIDEYAWSESTSDYSDHTKTTYYDFEEIPNLYSWYLKQHALENPSTGNIWVKHFDYDVQGRLIQEATTEAIASYTPISTMQPVPMCSLNATQGLVYAYDYTSEGRLTKTWLGEGETGSRDLVKEITYSSETNEGHLAVRVDLFTDASDTASEDKRETILYEYGFHDDTTKSLAWRRSLFESELESENGPNAPSASNKAVLVNGLLLYESFQLFDGQGRHRWTRSADHSLLERSFQPTTGVLLSYTQNADIANLDGSDYANLDTSTWENRGGEVDDDLTISYERDDAGWLTHQIDVDGNRRRIARTLAEHDARPGLKYYTHSFYPARSISGEFEGPVVVQYQDAAGQPFAQSAFALQDSSGCDADSIDCNFGEEVERAVSQANIFGQVEHLLIWSDIESDIFSVTSIERDQLGQVERVYEPNDTVRIFTRDFLGRVVAIEEGTGDGTDRVLLREAFIDSDDYQNPTQGVGNGKISVVIEYTGESQPRVEEHRAEMYYDSRGQLTHTKLPESPHPMFEYDNLGHIVIRKIVSDLDNPQTTMLDYERLHYTQRGGMYKLERAIDPTNLALGFLESHIWRDPVGRVIESWDPGGPATKIEYDDLSRVAVSYLTDRSGDAAPGASNHFIDAMNVAGDRILQQMEYTYQTDGRLQLEMSRQRLHDSTSTGALTANDSVSSFMGFHYDFAGRIRRATDYGTNDVEFRSGTAAPIINPNVWPEPGQSGGVIRTVGFDYNNRGMIAKTTDPEGRVHHIFYDDLQRPIADVENASGTIAFNWKEAGGGDPARWEVGGLSDDSDRVTTYYYDDASNLTYSMAHLPNGGTDRVQITEYVYGILNGSSTNEQDSLLASNDLLLRVIYPDATTIDYAYDRQGQLRGVTDQNATTHVYIRDAMGRPTSDRIEVALNSDIDDTVQEITAQYDNAGRRVRVDSLDENQSVLNSVAMTYSAMGTLDSVYQNNTGPATYDGNGEPIGYTRRVQYTHEHALMGPGGTGSQGNSLNLASMKYPGGDVLNYEYGGSSSLNGRLRRLQSMQFANEYTDIVRYEYLGAASFAVVDLMKPDIQLDRTVDDAGLRAYGMYADPSASGRYPGITRFGELAQQSWVDGDLGNDATHTAFPTRPHLMHEKYGFDRAGNVLYAYDGRTGAADPRRDREYEYDDFDRLTDSNRGSDASGNWTTGIGSTQYARDVLGNMHTVKTDLTGDGDYTDGDGSGANGDRDESRSYNQDNNKLDEMDLLLDPVQGTTQNLPFEYDDAGNMTQTTLDSGVSTVLYTYDAWNRLVKARVKIGNQAPRVRALYIYNALHWQIESQADHAIVPDDDLEEVREKFYDAKWRLLEEEVDDDATTNPGPDRRVQYVWGIRGIDDILVHRQDDDLDGDYDDEFYHLTDIQFSTVAITNANAGILERVSYDPYGKARHHFAGDLNGDGDYDAGDTTFGSGVIGQHIWEAGYIVEADSNRDGQITIADQAYINNLYGSSFPYPIAALPDGVLSTSSLVDNQVGWSGAMYKRETRLYLMRYRSYDPRFGAFIQQDPLGYVDGMNMYEYTGGNPVGGVDAYGLTDRYSGENNETWAGKGLFGFGGDDDTDLETMLRRRLCNIKETCRFYRERHENGEFDEDQWQEKMAWCKRMLEEAARELDELNSGWIDGFMEGMRDGFVLAVNNFTGLMQEEADKIREDHEGDVWLETGDWFSWGGAQILWFVAEEVTFGGACFLVKGACFEEGTLVETLEGPLPIEEIETGDLVLSLDVETGEYSYQEVVATSERNTPMLVRLTYSAVASDDAGEFRSTQSQPLVRESAGHTLQQANEAARSMYQGEVNRPAPIRAGHVGTTRERSAQSSSSSVRSASAGSGDDDDGCGPPAVATAASIRNELVGTPEHPIWSADEDRWIPMGALRVGERVFLAGGQSAIVESIETTVVPLAGSGTAVYNLEVANTHTFFVCSANLNEMLLVHNGVCGVSKVVARLFKNKRRGKAAERLFERMLKKTGLEYRKHVTFRTPMGNRILDFAVRYNSQWVGIEVKSGKAIRNAAQRAKDRWIGRFGGRSIGKHKDFVDDIWKVFEFRIP